MLVQPRGTCHSKTVPVRGPARSSNRPPWRAARASMFFRPCPRGAPGSRGADPVIDHPQHHLVGHDHLDVHTRRVRVTGDVGERFAQRREELGGEVVTDAAVDRTVEEASRFEPERPSGLATECQHTGLADRHPRTPETIPA